MFESVDTLTHTDKHMVGSQFESFPIYSPREQRGSRELKRRKYSITHPLSADTCFKFLALILFGT